MGLSPGMNNVIILSLEINHFDFELCTYAYVKYSAVKYISRDFCEDAQILP